MSAYEVGESKMREVGAWAAAHTSDEGFNEANTRLQLVDRLLIECLQWPRQHVEAERHQNGDYTDYELGQPTKRVVVEAKRTSTYFSLPKGFDAKTVPLRVLANNSSLISDAIDQVIRYCHDRGIPVGVICNGCQLAAFICSRQDGTAPRDGRAIVFDSLGAMMERFQELWDCLSPAGIESRHLQVRLGAEAVAPPPQKLAHRLTAYPGYRNRNPVAAELQVLGGLFLEDISQTPELEPEFVRETYCTNGALSQYALISKEILGARYSLVSEADARVTMQPASTAKGPDTGITRDLLAAGMSRRPMILLGNVGVGKSMFIKHLRMVDAAEILNGCVVIYLDFGQKPALPHAIAEFIWTEIDSQLDAQYGISISDNAFVRAVLHGDLNKFTKGINGPLRTSNPSLYEEREIAFLTELTANKDGYLRRVVAHLMGSYGKPVVIIFDNVDQRDPNFQDAAFLVAQSISSTWQATTFLALRPETFLHSRQHGTLAAYQPRVFTIDPPRVDRVIEKRLQYAQRKLLESKTLPGLAQGVTLSSGRLELYIKMLIASFEHSTDIVEFIDNMSNGNVRRALDFLVAFIGSAHVDSSKILSVMESGSVYRLPLHEFVRAVLLQDNEFYNPAESGLGNVYDISSNDRREHFLLLIVLGLLERRGQIVGQHGLVQYDEIFRHSQSLGFSEHQVSHALDRIIQSTCGILPTAPDEGPALRIRLTSAGAYVLKRLHHTFTYVDAIIVDTPIVDPRIASRLIDTRQINERLERAREFQRYLDACWDSAFGDLYDWPTHSKLLTHNINQVEQRLAK